MGVYGSLIKYHRKIGYRGQDRNNFRASVGVAVDRHTKNKKFQTKKWMLVMKTMLSYDEVTIQ